ncbi:transcriptional regulator [Achromatium sp. WMS3]|nr:transcriptional regulator [Achromatium sp. WMS3]
MNAQLQEISNVWPAIKHIFSVPHSEVEYQHLIEILDSLIDEVGNNQNHELAPVMETIGKLIENYEDRDSIQIGQATPLDVLKYLMQEHNLQQSDLQELGNKYVVAEIFNGQKTLNIQQIKKLSSKFHVSPLVFI